MKRNKFSLSHYKLLSADMGKLIPVGLQEVIPGDTFQHSTSLLVRTAPLLAPIMHPVRVRLHHFFVPYRLVWDEFEDFITGGSAGTSAPTVPYCMQVANTTSIGTLGDYLGANPCTTAGTTSVVQAMPFRAYRLIWNEFYRDQDLQTELTVETSSGIDNTADLSDLQSVCWEKDYFTTARPTPQKGAEVTIPTASIIGDGNKVQMHIGDNVMRDVSSYNDGSNNKMVLDGASVGGAAVDLKFGSTNTGLTTAMGTINELREAFAVQRFEEARSRYGSQYVEYLRYLGVRSSDARLQRPEYLGGGTQTIQFSEVLQNAEGTDPVGTMRGHGIAALRSNRYRRFFEEHGYVITLMSVVPKTIYSDGIPRHFLKSTKFDYHTKEFEHVGQQEVWGRELYPETKTVLGDESTFGYQDRYDEYRRAFSQVHGEFKNQLNFWHFARLFASAPTLNGDFVKSTPTTRTYAVTSSDPLYIMCNHSIQARRPISASGGSSFAL